MIGSSFGSEELLEEFVGLLQALQAVEEDFRRGWLDIGVSAVQGDAFLVGLLFGSGSDEERRDVGAEVLKFVLGERQPGGWFVKGRVAVAQVHEFRSEVLDPVGANFVRREAPFAKSKWV